MTAAQDPPATAPVVGGGVVGPTSWIHPEPVPGDPSLLSGLQAQAADPLWLLARQIGFGELSGHDRGSTILTEVQARVSHLTRMRAHATGSTTGVRLPDTGAPLEAVIEAEAEPAPRPLPDSGGPAPTQLPRPVIAAQYGMHYLRLLAAAGLTDLETYRTALTQRYPLPGAPGATGAFGPPQAAATTPIVRLYAGRVPDGQALYADLMGLRASPPTVASTHPLPTGGIDAITTPGLAWLDWYDHVAGAPLGMPAAAEPTWHADRLEYQAALAAPGPDAETIFTAAEHTAGHLDWYSFDMLASARAATPAGLTLGCAGDTADEDLTMHAIPKPVGYPGMPEPRFWTFEDSVVNFGDIHDPAEASLTAVVIEYVLGHGNDHYLIPVPLALGSLCRVSTLIVTTTFNERIQIKAVADLEPAGPFRLFEYTLPPATSGAAPARDPLLVLFPSVEQPMTGQAWEAVSYFRDELAELVWAVEQRALGPDGLPADRASATTGKPPAAAPATASAVRDYVLRTDVAHNWFPYLAADPTTRANPAQLSLALVEPVDANATAPVPWSTLLTGALSLQQEEVTRAGVQADRVWRYTRWSDGSHLTWPARRVRIGRGEGNSGLEYDLAVPPASE